MVSAAGTCRFLVDLPGLKFVSDLLRDTTSCDQRKDVVARSEAVHFGAEVLVSHVHIRNSHTFTEEFSERAEGD